MPLAGQHSGALAVLGRTAHRRLHTLYPRHSEEVSSLHKRSRTVVARQQHSHPAARDTSCQDGCDGWHAPHIPARTAMTRIFHRPGLATPRQNSHLIPNGLWCCFPRQRKLCRPHVMVSTQLISLRSRPSIRITVLDISISLSEPARGASLAESSHTTDQAQGTNIPSRHLYTHITHHTHAPTTFCTRHTLPRRGGRHESHDHRSHRRVPTTHRREPPTHATAAVAHTAETSPAIYICRRRADRRHALRPVRPRHRLRAETPASTAAARRRVLVGCESQSIRIHVLADCVYVRQHETLFVLAPRDCATS